MNQNARVFAVLTLSLMASLPIANTQAAPATAPAAKQPTAEEMQEKILPALDLQAVPLSDFLDFVSQLVPGFQFVIVRDPGVPGDFPILPSMKLKKVTFGQVMAIIQEAIPEIDFHPVESEHGAVIYVFKIHSANPAGAFPFADTQLKVYRLADVVNALAAQNAPPIPPGLEAGRGAAVCLTRTGGSTKESW